MGRGLIVVVACALALAGCQTDGGPGAGAAVASAEPPPADYRQQLIARVRKSFFDPYSIRDASISQPFYVSGTFDGVSLIPHSGWMVCLRANAKNRMGGYIGSKETGYLFKGGQIVDTDFHAHNCAKAAFQPFPEIEEGYKPAAPGNAPTARRRAS